MDTNPRIIQGLYKGRKLKVPDEGTRPFTDRVKKTLFDILQGQFEGKSVLDLFAGSGNLGLEAISSNASSVTFVDSTQDAISAISSNIHALGVEHFSKVVKADYKKFIKDNKEAFDIIFIDPPFKLIKKLDFTDFLPLTHQDSILIFKSNSHINREEFPLEIIDERKIGINYLYLMKKKMQGS
jgi:16S rRNA (guanine966-N2)-methyltransferase